MNCRGTLITFAYAVNGEWFDQEGNAADPLEDKVGLTTCSFTASNGFEVVLVGLLNLR